MWQTPVFDRTQADIDNRTPKGFRNASDINRIEENTAYIAVLLGTALAVKTWGIADIPPESEYRRILSNIAAVRDASGVMNLTLPTLPLNTWTEMTDVERALYEIIEYYNEKEQMKIYTGEIYSGDLGVV
jgi:hypothetical protein